VQTQLTVTAELVEQEVLRRACFLVATNVLDPTVMPRRGSHPHRQDQGRVERIIALSCVMVLCLLVYRLAEQRVRQQLAATGQTIPNQVYKPTARPMMRWVFQCFEGLDRLTIRTLVGPQVLVLHLPSLHEPVRTLLGPLYREIYHLTN
jgi:hypothetical protein